MLVAMSTELSISSPLFYICQYIFKDKELGPSGKFDPFRAFPTVDWKAGPDRRISALQDYRLIGILGS